jgi:tRNA threonylcarbamoyladenosine biosynthesis protein TsaB
MNVLSIDTTDNKKTIIKLNGDKNDVILHESSQHASQVVIPLIDQLLKRNKLTLKEIHEIQVNTGPGSFTGIRVGLAIANGLGFATNISVNGKALENYPDAQYA